MGERIIIGDQFAKEYHYDSVIGEEAVIVPWVEPGGITHYNEDTCFRVFIAIGASYPHWYIRKEDAMGFVEENASYTALLRSDG